MYTFQPAAPWGAAPGCALSVLPVVVVTAGAALAPSSPAPLTHAIVT
jgi:hypothetical protein